MSAHLTITRPGISYVTDLGRPGAGRVGQMTAGALDQYSVRVANTLVAADEHAPLLEVVAADFAMVTSVNLLIAVTGARPTWRCPASRCPSGSRSCGRRAAS